VHIGTLPVPSFRTVDRDDGVDAVRAHVGAVAQCNHPGRERRVALRGLYGEHVFDSSSARSGRPGFDHTSAGAYTTASDTIHRASAFGVVGALSAQRHWLPQRTKRKRPRAQSRAPHHARLRRKPVPREPSNEAARSRPVRLSWSRGRRLSPSWQRHSWCAVVVARRILSDVARSQACVRRSPREIWAAPSPGVTSKRPPDWRTLSSFPLRRAVSGRRPCRPPRGRRQSGRPAAARGRRRGCPPRGRRPSGCCRPGWARSPAPPSWRSCHGRRRWRGSRRRR
jgi:hypothetical protein